MFGKKNILKNHNFCSFN